MNKYRTLLLICVPLIFTGCGGSDSRAVVQSGGSNYQLSTQKGKKEMPTQSPMLNEIFEVRITDISSQRADVSHIVLQHIPLGIQKDELVRFISQDFELTENSDYKLIAHQFKGEGSLGTRKDVYIEFFFDGNKKLSNISAYIDKSNNL